MAMWLDLDLNAGPKLKVHLREEQVVFVDPRDGSTIALDPETHEEAVLMAIALRKSYKRLEELASGLPKRGKANLT